MVKHDKTQKHPYKYYSYNVYNGILMTRRKKGDIHYILSRYNGVERSPSNSVSYFESSDFLVSETTPCL